MSNNLGLPNEGKDIWVVGINYDYNNLNTLNAGADELDDDSRQRITNSILFALGYSFTDRLSMETLFTWVNQSRTIRQFGNEDFTETSGIGDAVFLLKYAFPEVLGRATVFNIGLGIKAPLGKSDLRSSQGIQLTADLQPGSGAWDELAWLSISKGFGFRPAATFSSSFTYRLTGKNKSYLNDTSTYEFGNVVQANVGYTDEFLLFNVILNPGLVVKYRNSRPDKIEGSDIPNTGGEWIFLRPELLLQLSPQIGIISRVEVPLYSYVDGTQLTPTLRFTAGMSFKLNTKKVNPINIGS